MTVLQAERFRLHGRYVTPRFKCGDVVEDLVRGPVQIVGITNARIPWPIGKSGIGKSLILYGALAEAVRNEAAQAIRYWWGVGHPLVWKWRKALGVPHSNAGTHKLHVRYAQEPFFKRAQLKARDPARRAKISAALLGKPRSPEVCARLAASKRGSRHSAATRRKMSLTHKQKWLSGPLAARRWTASQDELVRTLPPAEVAKRTGRTIKAVWSRRRTLGLTNGRTKPERAAIVAMIAGPKDEIDEL